MPTKNFLSFRELVLLDKPTKIDIIHNCNDFIALNKPNFIELDDSAQQHGKNIVTALRGKKPEAFYRSVYPLDCHISGCAIIATHRKASELLRNAYGSEILLFRFTMLCKNTEHVESEIICELPLAKHFSKPMAIISRNTGKKSRTKFKLMEQIGDFSIYEASCHYLRYHQLRIHGATCGLKLLGEDIYNDVPIPSLRYFKKIHFEKKPSTALFHSQCIHLSQVILHSSIYGHEITLEAKPPKNFEILLKIIRKFS
ncbi:MAG: hypothetical protein LBH49_01935 [Puniceicoccales bacterium]|nr:hypothetical protein [Puniceicoccales bacterium]